MGDSKKGKKKNRQGAWDRGMIDEDKMQMLTQQNFKGKLK